MHLAGGLHVLFTFVNNKVNGQTLKEVEKCLRKALLSLRVRSVLVQPEKVQN